MTVPGPSPSIPRKTPSLSIQLVEESQVVKLVSINPRRPVDVVDGETDKVTGKGRLLSTLGPPTWGPRSPSQTVTVPN